MGTEEHSLHKEGELFDSFDAKQVVQPNGAGAMLSQIDVSLRLGFLQFGRNHGLEVLPDVTTVVKRCDPRSVFVDREMSAVYLMALLVSARGTCLPLSTVFRAVRATGVV